MNMDDPEDTPPVSGSSAMLNHAKSVPSPIPVATTRVDRLLRERIRRNRSQQQFDYDEALYEGPLNNLKQEGRSDRLVVVANRLPVTCSKDSHGNWSLQVSAGGLVSALKGVSSYKTIWIGWPGIWVKPGKDRDALTTMLAQEGCLPVWIDPTLLDLYYNGFCNSVLWQLFHYVPLNIDSWQKMSEHRAMQMQWQAYQVANQKFADVVLEGYQAHDIVWVQDYHLMQLPSLLKAAVPKMKVGFFLHTPFPSSEMYRTLPVREEVLRAVLGADLIGFHTYDYARHFISSCTRILGLEGTPEGVENNGSITRVGTFPIGIDPERFTRAMETDEVQGHVAKLLNRYAGRKIMLGVDRLDMVKGIPQKLLAFEKFLEEHPEWRDKVLLVQIAVPSRTDVPEYQKLRSMVHEIVGRINGQFGTLTYVPIYHLDTSLSFTELCALYAVTDVALVTSLRDGMNLVSYEYVACQSDNAGVLVLSEFAGAAQSLGAGAILVNPWNITDMAQAIEDALSMSEEERRERHRQNYMHVQTHTAQNWADTFISELNDTHIEADLRMRHAPPPLDSQEVIQGYISSTRRIIVLGYNATLTTSVEAPRQPKRHFDQIKAMAKVNPKVLSSIEELCQDPANVVVVFSGSETHKLEELFYNMPVWLAAENGVYVRPPPSPRGGRPQWLPMFDSIGREWMESVQLVFDYFCERTPRSFVEARETSLVWNYKYADVEFGRIQARDLLQHLWTGPISNAPVEIIQGGKSVEVRPVGVTKGLAMQRLVAAMVDHYGEDKARFDFVLCIGHLLGRDENMFSYFEGHKVDGNATNNHNRGDRYHTGLGPHTQLTEMLEQMQQQQQERAAAAAAATTTTGGLPGSAVVTGLDSFDIIPRDLVSTSGVDLPPLGIFPPDSRSPLLNMASTPPPEPQPTTALVSPAVGDGPRLGAGGVHPSASGPGGQQAADRQAPIAAAASTLSPSGSAPAPLPPSAINPLGDGLPHVSPLKGALAGGLAAGGRPHPPSTSAGGAADSATAHPESATQLQHPTGALFAKRAQGPHMDRSSSVPMPMPGKGQAGGRSGLGGMQASGASAGGMGGNNHHNHHEWLRLQPPRYCFTCTVGRNRSKARYALETASAVADLLDNLVQQCIYHREPVHPQVEWPTSMSRVDSFSSTEPLSPDSMFALINNWKSFRRPIMPSSSVSSLGGSPGPLGLSTARTASIPVSGDLGPANIPEPVPELPEDLEGMMFHSSDAVPHVPVPIKHDTTPR